MVLDNGIGFGQALKLSWRWAYVFIKIMHAKVVKAQFYVLGGVLVLVWGSFGKKSIVGFIRKTWTILGECMDGFESRL